MSISFNDGKAYLGFFEFGKTRCFYCAEVIEDAGVSWEGIPPGDRYGGADGYRLVLHPHCVYALATRLFRDVHEYECRTHTHPYHQRPFVISRRKES